MPSVAGSVDDAAGGAVVGVLQADSVGEGGPEVVQHVPVRRDPFAGCEPDAPHLDLVGLGQQHRSDLVVVGVVGELLPDFGAPTRKVLGDDLSGKC